MMNPVLFLHHHFVNHRVPTETGGQAAREEATRRLAQVRSNTAYYEGLGADLRDLRERNHFAEQIRATMKGSHA